MQVCHAAEEDLEKELKSVVATGLLQAAHLGEQVHFCLEEGLATTGMVKSTRISACAGCTARVLTVPREWARYLAPIAAPARVAQANGRGAATVGRDALAASRALERAARLAACDAAPPLQAAAAPRRHALASTHQRATVVVRACM